MSIGKGIAIFGIWAAVAVISGFHGSLITIIVVVIGAITTAHIAEN